MAAGFQAIAVDYDGTLTRSDRPTPDVLAAIHEQRERGRVVVLVTGRILSELRMVFPEVDEEFDAIVAENGAVLADDDGVRDLAPPVDPALAQRLAHRDLPVRQGRVLLACEAQHDQAVIEEIVRLQLGCQLVHNRAAMMVLPNGVTKGTGLIQALGNLGISRHSTIAVGDAENDHHLLQVCELGVAVGNAVAALKRRADVVLDAPDGEGVAELLRGPLVSGARWVPPSNWALTIGYDDGGNEVQLPASQINMLLVGASCSGKSYLVGSLVEQLVRLDYSVLVLDREGDHRSLAERRGILGVGGKDPLPPPTQLADLLRHRFGSVVVDLSTLGDEAEHAYVEAIAPVLLAQRAVTGLPHWLFFDEAHELLADQTHWADQLGGGDHGYGCSSYLPEMLPEVVRRVCEVVVLTAGGTNGRQESQRYAAAVAGWPEDRLAALLGDQRGRAVLIDRSGATPPRAFTVAERSSGHVRHWHKYIDGELPEPLRFYFSEVGDGFVASNLREFHRHLGSCRMDTLEAHARRHDLSRWLREVLQDDDLAEVISDAEHELRTDRLPVEGFRDAVRTAIEAQYLEWGSGADVRE
jgi:hydroxymethylpyrimidine pyrophosphatase-like HAD family hydrolase